MFLDSGHLSSRSAVTFSFWCLVWSVVSSLFDVLAGHNDDTEGE